MDASSVGSYKRTKAGTSSNAARSFLALQGRC
jgi:hypothetical protein